MVIDTSALVAILSDEPEAGAMELVIERAESRLMSAATMLETAIVIEARYGEAGGRELDLWLYKAQVEVVAVSRDLAELARAAYRQYGRGGHPAALNFGDCFSYALAKITGEPLLFKGNDFKQTDLVLCEY